MVSSVISLATTTTSAQIDLFSLDKKARFLVRIHRAMLSLYLKIMR